MQRLRDNPACADEEYERLLDRDDPGLAWHLGFDPGEDVAAPMIATGGRPYFSAFDRRFATTCFTARASPQTFGT